MIKKATLFLAGFVLFFAIMPCRAQVMSGFGVETGIPVGELRTFADVGVGLGAEFRIFPIERLATGMHASWLYYLGGHSSFAIISIRGKAEYFFTDEGALIRPYTGIEPGIYVSSYSGKSAINFGVSPSAGVLFAMSDFVNLVANVRYNFIFDDRTAMYTGVGLSLIYTIKDKKRR